LQAEAAHYAKTKGRPAPTTEEPEAAINTAKWQLENGEAGNEEDPEAKRRRILEETRDIDAESEDDDEDDSSDDDSDDDEDETAELQRELEKIKRERAEKREQEVRSSIPEAPLTWLTQRKQEQEKTAAEEAAREKDIAMGNPLLNPKTDFNVKRR
jgi:protein CWC15